MDEITTWVQRAFGVEVTATTTLLGGMSSDVRRVDLANGRSIVVRHITDRDWLDREPYLIPSEAAALELMTDSPVAVPAHLASDADRGLLAMSFEPGDVTADPATIAARVTDMAAAAVAIARVALPDDHAFVDWRPWVPAEPSAPPHGDQPLWDEAVAAWRGRPAPQCATPVLLHRDLHPLNLLWDNDAATPTVIDWVNACVGHPHAEWGHMRANLAMSVGHVAADEFRAEGERLAPEFGPYDRWWDLVDLLGLLPGPIGLDGYRAVGRRDLTEVQIVRSLEALIREALDSF